MTLTRTLDENAEPAYLTDFEADGRRYTVSVRIFFDGIEYVGRLAFTEEDWPDDPGLSDRGALPGRSRDEVMQLAARLTPKEIMLRYRRALSEKRRFSGLRQATDEILLKIRYLNQVAISMRSGMLDTEGAAQEIALTERQLHDLVDKLPQWAGVEDGRSH